MSPPFTSPACLWVSSQWHVWPRGQGGEGRLRGPAGREGAESSPADSFQTWNNWMFSILSFWLNQWGCSLRTRVSVFSLYLNILCDPCPWREEDGCEEPTQPLPLAALGGTCFLPVRQLVSLWPQWVGPWPVPCKDPFVGIQPHHSWGLLLSPGSHRSLTFSLELLGCGLTNDPDNCWFASFLYRRKSQGSVASNLGCNSHLTPLPATCLSDRRQDPSVCSNVTRSKKKRTVSRWEIYFSGHT